MQIWPEEGGLQGRAITRDREETADGYWIAIEAADAPRATSQIHQLCQLFEHSRPRQLPAGGNLLMAQGNRGGHANRQLSGSNKSVAYPNFSLL